MGKKQKLKKKYDKKILYEKIMKIMMWVNKQENLNTGEDRKLKNQVKILMFLIRQLKNDKK